MIIEHISKNTYKFIKQDVISATARLSSDLGVDTEILLNGDMSNDGIIFYPDPYPTEETDDFIIIGFIRRYSFERTNNVKARFIERSLVSAVILESEGLTSKEAKDLVIEALI